MGRRQAMLSDQLRQELALKGLKGFKRGGKVKKTGPAKLHKGERVLTAKQAKAHAKTPPKRTAKQAKAHVKTTPKRTATAKRAAPKRRSR